MKTLRGFFVLIAIACKVAGQVSPCPESFQYQNDNGNIFGIVYLKPGYTGRITTTVGFTVASQLPSSYVGKLSLMDSRLSSQAYKGLHISGIRYRVDFPVTSPLPQITFVRVNDEDLCHSGVDPDPTHIKLGAFKTTIKLQHVLILNNGDYHPRPPSGPFGAYQGDYTTKPTTPAAADEKNKGKGIDIYKIHSKAARDHPDSDESDDEDDDEQNHKNKNDKSVTGNGAAPMNVFPHEKQIFKQETTYSAERTVIRARQSTTLVGPRRKREHYDNTSG